MASINPVLGVFSLYHELPAAFTDRFTTVEQKWFDRYRPIAKDTIFHSGMSLVDDTFLPVLEQQNAFEIIRKNHIRRFSFDVGPCFRRVKTVDNRYVGIGGKLSVKEIHAICSERIAWLRSKLPFYCEIAVENLNYYPTGAYENVCEPEFYNDICARYELGLVLDMGHAQVTAYNQKEDFAEHLLRFDPDTVREFHLSRISIINDDEAIDFHDVPGQEEFQIMCNLIQDHRRKYDVVIEYWQSTGPLMGAYAALETFLDEKSKNHTAS
jgi:hypothetical protein